MSISQLQVSVVSVHRTLRRAANPAGINWTEPHSDNSGTEANRVHSTGSSAHTGSTGLVHNTGETDGKESRTTVFTDRRRSAAAD